MATKHPSKLTPKEKKSQKEIPMLLEASRQFTILQTSDVDAAEFLPVEAPTRQDLTPQEIILSELQAARLLNVDMPDEPKQFIHLLEARVREITGTRKNVVLILDEESGTYTCLNDEASDDFATSPRELTWISDNYLQELLGSNQVIHSFLHHQGNVFGIIAIADKLDGTPFGVRDEIILEQLTQYLSVQVNHFLTLKRSVVLPTIQRTLLHISNRLLSAIDSPAIFQGVIASILEELPFTAGQYIQLDRESGKGHVFYQLTNGTFDCGENIQEVDQFVSLLSLLKSRVWKHPFLYLKGKMLGDKPFSEIFGLPEISSVLLLPLVSEDTNLDGALVLFQQGKSKHLSKEALKVIEQVPELVISACGRAQVLEKALEIALTDELTGALNRRGFYSRFDAEVDRARRNLTPMCMAILDVDHFKILNDTYGHLVGDQILKQLCSFVQQNIRKSDLLCRFGGEEFTLVLPETSLTAGAELIDRLRRKIDKLSFQTPAGPVKVTFSAGVDLVETASGLSKDAMQVISESLARADEALYEAKQLGRNRIVVVDSQ